MLFRSSDQKSEEYFEGISYAKSKGDIVYYGGVSRFLSPAYDDFGFIEKKGGSLTHCNTRHLEPSTDIVLRIHSLLSSDNPAQRCMFLGPGSGVEIGDALDILPTDSVTETLSMTPVHPKWCLRKTRREIQEALTASGLLYEDSSLPKQTFHPLSIDQVWKHRERLHGIFQFSDSPPLVHKQHIGLFPQHFRKWFSSTLSIATHAYDCALENRGPLYYAKTDRDVDSIFSLLCEKGVLCSGTLGGTKNASHLFHQVANVGDVAFCHYGIDSPYVHYRAEHPFAQFLRDEIRYLEGLHYVKDIQETLTQFLSMLV